MQNGRFLLQGDLLNLTEGVLDSFKIDGCGLL